MARRACGLIVAAFAALYALALAILIIGAFGLFGQPRDPLSGVFLLPLGLPWNLWLDGAPEAALPWLAALAPALNMALLWLLCRALARGGADPR